MLKAYRERLARASIAYVAAIFVLTAVAGAQQVTTPEEQFGFGIGADYHLANYTQLSTYWAKLADESPRMVLDEIGKTEEGRPQYMAIITSPENHRNLARYREIAAQLARAEGLTGGQARALAMEGKAVVWIDGGLHATEVLGAHQLMEFVYYMVSRSDPETMRILDDVILLAVHANPDGMELVSNWYMRNPEPEERSLAGVPRLYQKYIGHDNNRDFFLASQAETENMARVQYHEWFPQIVYNHHQTGPAGTVLFAPPFRDPFNYNLDPMVPIGIDQVASAMHNRFLAEGKPGATMRSGAPYSTWWNGGLRTTTYFHNMIGLLTETIGSPTPIEIMFVPSRHLAHGDMPAAIEPQKWHFRQSVEYSRTANLAVLDYASRYRETLLFNIYRMGQNSIDRGSRDHWTVEPKHVARVDTAIGEDTLLAQLPPIARQFLGLPSQYFSMLRNPEERDPRGYIIPSSQTDFPTATKFVNALIKNGITIHRAARDFSVEGTTYPTGSYVVKTAQAFRPHILDMFEPQDHPNDIPYPGASPTPPYDQAGWTLAYQMDVQFDRILDGFDGPFEVVDGFATPPPGTVADAGGAAGFLLSHEVNDAFVVMNRLLADGEEVYWLSEEVAVNGSTYPAGTMYVPRRSTTTQRLERLAQELGVNFDGVSAAPPGSTLRMRRVRIGLWDQHGGSMPSGWTRWLLEQFEFPFEVVYPPTLDDGNLSDQYDVLVFPDGAIPRALGGGGLFAQFEELGRRLARIPAYRAMLADFFGGDPDPEMLPPEYRSRVGSVTVETTVPKLVEFLEEGGTVITIGSSVGFAVHAGLPVENHLVDAEGKPLRDADYYVPGSILRARVDNSLPIAWGTGGEVDVSFNNSPTFKITDGPGAQNVRRIAWFDGPEPLRSGWAWGQQHLEGGVAMAQASVGQGKLYLFGPEVLWRGQPHGTFKFFFNGIYLAGAEERETPRTEP
jgi:hypothetical protein